MRKIFGIVGVLGSLLLSSVFSLDLSKLQLPPGFHVDVYAEHVPKARELALGDQGIVYVGTLDKKVFALIPSKDFTKAEKVITVADNLNFPNGVAYHQGNLYVAEINRVLRFPNITEHLTSSPKAEVILDKLPSDKWHGYRVIEIGPDEKIYMGIGMPCNTCLPKDPIFGTIVRFNTDGSQFEIFAKGIRNAMGFDWQPKTHDLWFTDNGQDMLGDNYPPDKVNRSPKAGMDFGFPYFIGNLDPSPQYGRLRSRQGLTRPALNLPAHVAPLGMKFYSAKMFPEKYRNHIFIAEHGSWNRSKKVGYRLTWARVVKDRITRYEPFLTGFLQDEEVEGRPVDLLVMPDGSLLVSDDYNGVVYRVSHKTR